MKKSLLKRMIPDREQLEQHPWIRRLGPRLLDPRLWSFSRRGVALGAALGVFFGFLIPVAQIPASALAAVMLRAYVPAAVGSTLVTNPVTFAPVYYFAHQLGAFVLGEEAPSFADVSPVQSVVSDPDQGFMSSVVAGIDSMGKPLITGLLILAVAGGLLTYVAVMLVWRIRTIIAWRRRKKPPVAGD